MDFAKGMPCKTPTVNSYGLKEASPASLPKPSSQPTVSSSVIRCIEASGVMMMSGREVVAAMFWVQLLRSNLTSLLQSTKGRKVSHSPRCEDLQDSVGRVRLLEPMETCLQMFG